MLRLVKSKCGNFAWRAMGGEAERETFHRTSLMAKSGFTQCKHGLNRQQQILMLSGASQARRCKSKVILGAVHAQQKWLRLPLKSRGHQDRAWLAGGRRRKQRQSDAISERICPLPLPPDRMCRGTRSTNLPVSRRCALINPWRDG